MDDRLQVRIIAVREDTTIGWNQLDQVAESALHIAQVPEDIRMVELKVIENQNVRTVVDELAPLVEKGAVVFIPLNDKRGCGISGSKGT